MSGLGVFLILASLFCFFLGIIALIAGKMSFIRIVNRKQAGYLVITSFMLFIVSLAILASSESSSTSNRSTIPSQKTIEKQIPTKKEPRFEITITKKKYEYGYLELAGTVKNTGNAPAFSPQFWVKVYKDKDKKVLLAEDTAFIAGQFLNKMEPEKEAAFECITHIPGEPDNIVFEYGVK